MALLGILFPEALRNRLVDERVHNPHRYASLNVRETFTELSINDDVDLVRNGYHRFQFNWLGHETGSIVPPPNGFRSGESGGAARRYCTGQLVVCFRSRAARSGQYGSR